MVGAGFENGDTFIHFFDRRNRVRKKYWKWLLVTQKTFQSYSEPGNPFHCCRAGALLRCFDGYIFIWGHVWWYRNLFCSAEKVEFTEDKSSHSKYGIEPRILNFITNDILHKDSVWRFFMWVCPEQGMNHSSKFQTETCSHYISVN